MIDVDKRKFVNTHSPKKSDFLSYLLPSWISYWWVIFEFQCNEVKIDLVWLELQHHKAKNIYEAYNAAAELKSESSISLTYTNAVQYVLA